MHLEITRVQKEKSVCVKNDMSRGSP